MTKIQKFKNYPVALLMIFAVFFMAMPVFAAETYLEVKNSKIQVGDKFEAEFFLNTDNEDINAVEGKIIFSEKLFELKEIKDGNSIINFWIERPKAKNGEILFSGVVPGGYMDKKGLIFSVVFRALQEGQGSVEIRDIKVLLNDGKGTAADTIISNLQLVVSGQAPASQPLVVEGKDTDIPEEFEPQIAADPAIFEGKWFLVFATQDKGTGIDHYEVREGKRSFVIVESPYLLQNQSLNEEIAVKAVDKSGNERIATLPPQKPLPWYKNYRIFVILIMVGMVLAYLIRKFLWRKLGK